MSNPFGVPYIATDDLVADDVPARATNWRSVVEFAATFDVQSERPNGTVVSGVADITAESTTNEMRAALFAEWRRHNHFGYGPDQTTVNKTQAVLDWLRSR